MDAPNRSATASPPLAASSATPSAVDVAIIHRNRYDDWTLPKGKLRPGETAAPGRSPRGRRGNRLPVAVQRRLGRGGYRVGRVSKSVSVLVDASPRRPFRGQPEVDR